MKDTRGEHLMQAEGSLRDIQGRIQARARKAYDPAGREIPFLKDADAQEIASGLGITVHEVYQQALRCGICPRRYLRNGAAISLEEQWILSTSCVAVVGAGGLGGHVILLLARMGIGHLIVIDHDRFDETNLNRQALSSPGALGRLKSEEAAAVVAAVNPGVRMTSHPLRIDPSNASEILSGADVVVDALDNIQDRFVIEDAARSRGIPLVHGALAGLEGQVMTVFPGDAGLKRLYTSPDTGEAPAQSHPSRSPEAVLGVPTLTPALIATLQAAEVFKVLLKRGSPFRNVMVHVDLETGEMSHFSFGEVSS